MHQKYKGRLIDFGGWELPVEYQGIIAEHHHVRTQAGLFDVSHMGEIAIEGEQAEDFINELVTNDITGMAVGQIRYSPMCYEDGGVVDDLMVYKFSDTYFWLIVNAANVEKDFAWIKEHQQPGVKVLDLSEQYAEVAIQGPLSREVLERICDADLGSLKYYWFLSGVQVAGMECLVSRTGYTGEDGFEIYVKPEEACDLWEAIIKAGEGKVIPCGLGARDTLRFEAKMPLYGHEMDKGITPLEAGFDRFVKLEKPSFIGKDALARQQAEGPSRLLVEFEMIGRGIPRAGYEVHKNGERIGHVTSGGYAPVLDKSLGLCLIDKEFAQPGEEISIIIRNREVKAQTGKGLFYRRSKR